MSSLISPAFFMGGQKGRTRRPAISRNLGTIYLTIYLNFVLENLLRFLFEKGGMFKLSIVPSLKILCLASYIPEEKEDEVDRKG